MDKYGLIGYPLSHSFSKKYFTEKFERLGIGNARYDLYELPDIARFPELVQTYPELKGLNVTIPHKQAVIDYLHSLDEAAARIGAVNVIKVEKDGKLKGYNSDYYGFKDSLLNFIPATSLKALVLGTGGASKAVQAALEDVGIEFLKVSRQAEGEVLSYAEIDRQLLKEYHLIINTTPLGMYPKAATFPDLPFEHLSEQHYLFDLVYNPSETVFMQKGIAQGAKAVNGLEMLHLQAEKAWQIWQM